MGSYSKRKLASSANLVSARETQAQKRQRVHVATTMAVMEYSHSDNTTNTLMASQPDKIQAGTFPLKATASDEQPNMAPMVNNGKAAEMNENIPIIIENDSEQLNKTGTGTTSDAEDISDPLLDESEAIAASIQRNTGDVPTGPIPINDAQVLLEELDGIINPPQASGIGFEEVDIDRFTYQRLNAMVGCLRLYCGNNFEPGIDWTFTRASVVAAVTAGYSPRYGKKICQFIRHYQNTGAVPANNFGHSKTTILENKDIAAEIKLHIRDKGKYVKAEDIVNYLKRPDVKERFKLENAPSLRTTQQWMKDLGFDWADDPKGQYVDGHEREDVIKYQNEVFIPAWTKLERRVRTYDSKTMEVTLPNLEPGEKEVMIWGHDETIFRGNERRVKRRWVGNDETPIPAAKGDGGTLMYSNFISVDGWLTGINPDETARVIMHPGQHDGYMTNEDIRAQLKVAIRLAKEKYPHCDHVFLYDNATIHTKRRDNAPTASGMPLKPSKVFGSWTKDTSGNRVKVNMRDARFADGSPQNLYFPSNHPTHKNQFKGVAEILRERGIDPTGLKIECPRFKCADRTTGTCCARQILFNQLLGE